MAVGAVHERAIDDGVVTPTVTAVGAPGGVEAEATEGNGTTAVVVTATAPATNERIDFSMVENGATREG